jgi:hypothetical protein
MSKTENIKLYIKKSGDCYKVVNEKMYSNSNSLTPNKTNKKCSTKKIKDKGIVLNFNPIYYSFFRLIFIFIENQYFI